jgi:hypothetical protein
MTDPAAAIAAFTRDGYAVIPGLVAPDRVAALRDHLAARATAGTLRMGGDDQVPGTPSVYGDAQVDRLMGDIQPLIEAHTGLSLHPTYSYARIYKTGDTLAAHRDRPACQVSISLNLGQELTHWRDAYEGTRLFQAFIHYVDANGPHAGEKLDARAGLGNAFKPEMTGRLAPFLVPGLTGR